MEPGVEGLVHISQLANRRVGEPGEVVQVGDQVKVYILDVNEEDRRISLSMKEVEERFPEEMGSTEEATYEAEREAVRAESDTGIDVPEEETLGNSGLEEEEGEILPGVLGGGMRIGEVLGELLENHGHLESLAEDAAAVEEDLDIGPVPEEETAEELPSSWSVVADEYQAEEEKEIEIEQKEEEEVEEAEEAEEAEEVEEAEEAEEAEEEENEPGLHY